jgi:hypothetical protein
VPSKAVWLVSATSAPQTSGVDSQYGIGVQAASGMASIAARIFLFWPTVTENSIGCWLSSPRAA